MASAFWKYFLCQNLGYVAYQIEILYASMEFDPNFFKNEIENTRKKYLGIYELFEPCLARSAYFYEKFEE